jgi:hypothetical protein
MSDRPTTGEAVVELPRWPFTAFTIVLGLAVAGVSIAASGFNRRWSMKVDALAPTKARVDGWKTSYAGKRDAVIDSGEILKEVFDEIERQRGVRRSSEVPRSREGSGR